MRTPRSLSMLVLGLSTAAALVLADAPAYAWKHIGNAWLPEDMPIRYWVADDGGPNTLASCEASGGLEGCCEETVPQGYCKDVAAESYDNWHAAQCASYSVEYAGVAPNIHSQDNHLNYITYNDPGNEILEAGTWAVTTPRALGVAFYLNGNRYSHTYDADIVFNDNAVFDSADNILAGHCDGGASMRSVLTHEIGHFFGMDHSCEDPNKGGGPCTDPALRAATMYWAAGTCDDAGSTIEDDDIQGFTALYGPSASFSCSHQVSDDLAVGVVPFDLNCVVVSNYLSEVDSAEWNFGDGGTSTDINPSHTYTEPGNYTIQMTVHGNRAACGEDGWNNDFRKVGYVRACGEPDPNFEVSHVDGLRYQMLNDSDVSVYGCISEIEWLVFKGDSTSGDPIVPPLRAWEPEIEFPEPGTYTVVMNLGGIGGTTAAKVVFDARDYRGVGYGCDTSSGAGGAGLLGAIGLLGLGSRRRGRSSVT